MADSWLLFVYPPVSASGGLALIRRVGPLPKPFLKWAGGKAQLLPELVARVDAARPFRRYHEPFVGGGALFFELYNTKRLRAEVCLSDNNPNLIDAYLGVRDCVEEVIALLKEHKARHSKEYYYEMRATVPEDLPARAARIIYLNRTCFNGLYRENSRGLFNVPMGRYANPLICDEENLRAVSCALASARIECRPFETVLKEAEPKDLVYFDPPYHPVSKTAYFTSYDKNGFGEAEQRRLAEVFAELAKRRVKVLLSNSMTQLVQDLYAAFTIDTVQARRSVNSRPDRRGAVSEALVRSF